MRGFIKRTNKIYTKKLSQKQSLFKTPIILIKNCFIGSLIQRGNKIRAQRIFTKILKIIRQQINVHPLKLINHVLTLIKPTVNLVIRKRGPHSFKIPTLITRERAFRMAIHWLLKAAKNNSGNVSFAIKVANEVFSILENKPSSLVLYKSELNKTIILSRSNFKKLRRHNTSMNKLPLRQRAQFKWRQK